MTMTNDPENHVHDGAGSKKRKRKRPKKYHEDIAEPIVDDIRVNKSNKTKFYAQDEVSEEIQLNLKDETPTSLEKNINEPQRSTSGFLRLSNDKVLPYAEDTVGNEIHQDVQTKTSSHLPSGNSSANHHHIPERKKKKKTVFFDGDDNEDGDEADEEARPFRISQCVARGSLAKKAQDLLEVRERLPIYQHREKILDYVARNQVTVIIGETGSGKSTQIPQLLMPHSKKRIAVTQPRRVAAASLASRVSEEYGCIIGQEIGYQVRFSNLTSGRTKVNYLTDGMLIRELMLDPTLSKYSTIVIDEAHERTVLTDLILGFLKQLMLNKKRSDLKVIVMSATLNADLFSRFFDHVPIVYIEGKMYPVSRHYLCESSEDIVDTMIKAVVQLNMAEHEGDVLCFLPGQEEIDNCVSILNTLAPELPKEAPLIVALPLYAALSPGKQLKIFEKLGARKRKVILATNIAETSITVSGVKYVIDSGLRKVKVWKHQLGLSSLLTTPISQASAKQRAGRAGRESAGKVFRLYSEKVFLNKLPQLQESEILRNDIILPVLTLKKMGVNDLLNWSWLEHPGRDSILSALNTLCALGALDNAGSITPLGIKMAVLPLPPALSAVLISAFELGVLQDVIDIVSCLSVDNVILNVGGNGELRDEIKMKRLQYSPWGIRLGDLIALKEFFDYFRRLDAQKSTVELKLWCKEMFFSYKGFRNVLKVRTQLTDYMTTTIKQDASLNQHERETQLKNLHIQLLHYSDESDNEDGFHKLLRLMNIDKILKAFLKGFALNTAIGMPDRSFRTCATGQLISIHPSSILFGKSNMDAVMFIEYVYTAKAYGRTCSRIELGWLQEVVPLLLGGVKENINE